MFVWQCAAGVFGLWGGKLCFLQEGFLNYISDAKKSEVGLKITSMALIVVLFKGMFNWDRW